MEPYEVYAVHYAHNPNARRANNFIGGDPHDGPMPLDYFVWAIKGAAGTYVFDTGFDAPMGEKRKRQFVRSPSVGLKAIGVEPGDVRDVILSHMHYDHCGNYDLFPHARYHVQDIEMAYATGRCMCHAGLRGPFEEEDVVAMVRKLFAGRVVFHDGVDELAPGLTVHHVGGHSKGLQVVRAWTRRGWMVLASDASTIQPRRVHTRTTCRPLECPPTWCTVSPGANSSTPSWKTTRPANSLRTIATTSSSSNGPRRPGWHMHRPVA